VVDAVEGSEETIDDVQSMATEELADGDALSDDIPDDEEGFDVTSTEFDDLDMEIVEDSVEPETNDPIVNTPIHESNEGSSSKGFVPLVVGGVIAGAIGYSIATFYPFSTNSDDLSNQLAAQAEQISALEAQIAETPTFDLSGVEWQIAEASVQASEQLGEVATSLGEQLAELEARLSDVERTPNGDGTLSDTALAAYQRELDQLREEMNAQQESVLSAAAQAEADLAAAREEAAVLEQQAIDAATAAGARAALNRVATAVETGAPFADALSDLEGAELPVALTNSAETGVATTAQLIQDFPIAARAALATARSEGLSDDAGGLGGFFRSQFDVRSTSPQDGPGPDAVLSRAEAAIKEGRVSDALAEIEALPEVARAEMTDWVAMASERADVLDAIATLSETYN